MDRAVRFGTMGSFVGVGREAPYTVTSLITAVQFIYDCSLFRTAFSNIKTPGATFFSLSPSMQLSFGRRVSGADRCHLCLIAHA